MLRSGRGQDESSGKSGDHPHGEQPKRVTEDYSQYVLRLFPQRHADSKLAVAPADQVIQTLKSKVARPAKAATVAHLIGRLRSTFHRNPGLS